MPFNSAEMQAIFEILNELEAAAPGLLALVQTTETPLAKELQPGVEHLAYLTRWWFGGELSPQVTGGASASSRLSKRGRSGSGHPVRPISSPNPKAGAYGSRNKANRSSGRAPSHTVKR